MTNFVFLVNLSSWHNYFFELILAEFPQLLHDKEAVDKLYKLVQSEIESGLDYLLQKRKEDTYESFIPRAIFEGTWGRSAPTFKP